MSEYQSEPQYNFAGFWRRTVAGLIDFIILSILPAAWIGVAFLAFGSPIQPSDVSAFGLYAPAQEVQDIKEFSENSRFSQQQRIAGWASNIFSVVFVIGFWTWRGQTPGKMLFKMRIIKKDGSPIGLRDSILRFVGQIIGLTLLCIGFFMIGWDRRKQGLHDKIAGTYVVQL